MGLEAVLELSSLFIAKEVQSLYGAMLIALPPKTRRRYDDMSGRRVGSHPRPHCRVR